MPPVSRIKAATADRRARLGRGGLPDSADMIGSRPTVRAGHQAAATALATQRTAPAEDPPRDVETIEAAAGGILQCWNRAIQPAKAISAPATAAARPTAAPSAIMTRRTWRLVAPAAASRPS